ncbi:MAG: hypothetical protein AAB654_09075, partial [Acidobacteriota bacterium]
MTDSVLSFRPSADYDEALARAAEAWGVEPEYWDIWGNHHVPTAHARQAVLGSLGIACDSREQLDRALEERLWREWSGLAPATIVASAHGPLEIAVSIPAELSGGMLTAEVRWEDGASETVETAVAALTPAGEAELRGRRFARRTLVLPFALRLGYHELRLAVSVAGRTETSVVRLILGPDQAWLPARLEQGG